MEKKLEMFSDVIIKKTGQRGTIIDEGTVNGRHYFMVELDNAAEIDDANDPYADLPYCWDDELEPVTDK